MEERTTCVVVGGGPAGLVLGLLLARAGVEVTVLEKHGDFLRDFRGDTVHPSTLQLLDELGLGSRFAALPQSRLEEIAFPFADGSRVVVGDLRRLQVRHPYIAMVPQWDLLNLLAAAGAEEPTYTLRMRTEVTGLLREGGRVQRRALPHGGRRDRRDPRRPDRGVRRALVGRPPRERPAAQGVPGAARRLVVPAPAPPGDNLGALTPAAGRSQFGLVIPREDFLQLGYIQPEGHRSGAARAGDRGVPEGHRRAHPVAGATASTSSRRWTTSSTSTCGSTG